jgi:hypothetical protein
MAFALKLEANEERQGYVGEIRALMKNREVT